jgi:hypothetical protein
VASAAPARVTARHCSTRTAPSLSDAETGSWHRRDAVGGTSVAKTSLTSVASAFGVARDVNLYGSAQSIERDDSLTRPASVFDRNIDHTSHNAAGNQRDTPRPAFLRVARLTKAGPTCHALALALTTSASRPTELPNRAARATGSARRRALSVRVFARANARARASGQGSFHVAILHRNTCETFCTSLGARDPSRIFVGGFTHLCDEVKVRNLG